MKKFFKAIGDFFKKIGLFIWKYLKIVGLFIWKYLKICWNYIKENAWIQPIAIVVLIFALVFGFQGIVNGIEKIKENKQEKEKEVENLATQLTMQQVIDKIDAKEDFVLFVGWSGCWVCKEFKSVVNSYIKATGKTIYYFATDDLKTQEDVDHFEEWTQKMHDEITTRTFINSETNEPYVVMPTPTVIVVQDGKFADAKTGGIALNGGMEFLAFKEFVEGKWIGRVESSAN